MTLIRVSGAKDLKISPTLILAGLSIKLLSRNTTLSGCNFAIYRITCSGIALSKHAIRSPHCNYEWYIHQQYQNYTA